jgi:potassium voltage-gated channel Shaker-related subfamily A protein
MILSVALAALPGPRIALAGLALTRIVLTRIALTRIALTRIALTRIALTGIALTGIALTRVARIVTHNMRNLSIGGCGANLADRRSNK